VRWTLPRLRIDQVMMTCLKYILPMSCVLLVGVCLWRLVLPEDLCRKLGLKGEVALVGGQGRFEVWNLQRWKRAHEEETPTYQHVASAIGL